jgi:PAS domain S-box-containing protein
VVRLTVPPAFDRLAELLPEPMVLVSTDGIVQAANRAFAALLSRESVSPTRRSLEDLGWSRADGWSEYLRRCARTASFTVGAATHRQTDGVDVSYRCEGALYAPRAAERGAVVLLRFRPKASSSSRFVALTQQIGELSAEIARRQRAEAEARRQRELLHVTLSSIGDAVIATDRSGRVTFMNDVAEQLTGWSRSAAINLDVGEIFRILNEDSREAVEHPVAKVLALGHVVGLANHTVLIARDGTERPIDDSGAPIVDALGELHGVVLVFRDVTELRAAERQEAAARQAAEAANRTKDAFLATLSHELRTPLNAILGWTRMLRQGTMTEARQAYALQVVERNAAMQARLVEDLLDVSRIMVGQLRLQYASIDVAQIVDAALDAVRPAAENKGLGVSSTVRVRSAVHGDATRLQQVLWNLLTNAVKFTPPGGTISVDVVESDASVRIVVRDSGEGIPESFRATMFDAFTQADSSFTRPHGGLGLGLTIVRQLVEAHGGRIEAESGGVNRGATFTVTLPLSRQGMPAGPSVPSGLPIRDLGGCRVLAVEDDGDSAELTKTVLETAGAEVVACNCARDALAALGDGHFDVLVADIGLPGEDGLWLIQHVRRLPQAERGALPAVALTAFASAADRHAALAAGYDDHVPKPLDVDVFLRAIGRVRARRSERQRSERPSGS